MNGHRPKILVIAFIINLYFLILILNLMSFELLLLWLWRDLILRMRDIILGRGSLLHIYSILKQILLNYLLDPLKNDDK